MTSSTRVVSPQSPGVLPWILLRHCLVLLRSHFDHGTDSTLTWLLSRQEPCMSAADAC